MPVPFTDTWVPNGPFPIVNDEAVQGGFRVIDWDDGTYASAEIAIEALIPYNPGNELRKTGMVVRAREINSGVYSEHIWDGAAWADYTPVNAGSGARFGVADGLDVSNPTARDFEISPGAIFLWNGEQVRVGSTVAKSLVSDGQYWLVWDASAGDFDFLANTAIQVGDFPLAYVESTAGVLTRWVPCAPKSVPRNFDGKFRCAEDWGDTGLGPRTPFRNPYDAMVWRSAFGNGADFYKGAVLPLHIVINQFLDFGDSNDAARRDGIRFPGTASGTSGAAAVITGVSTRFKRDFKIGDAIYFTSSNVAEVSAVASDTSLTVVNLPSTVAAVIYGRSAYSGPNAYSLDASKPEILQLDNVTIESIEGEETEVDFPYISWGGDAVTAYEPFVRGTSGTTHWKFRNLTIDSQCLRPNADVEAESDIYVVIDRPSEQWEFENVVFDTFETAVAEGQMAIFRLAGYIGGPYGEESGMTFRGCVLGFGNGSAFKTCAFYVDGSSFGDLIFDNCILDANSRGDAIIRQNNTVANQWVSGAQFTNCGIGGFPTNAALFNHVNGSGAGFDRNTSRRYLFDNCQIGDSSSTPWQIAAVDDGDTTTDHDFVTFNNCQFTGDIKFIGTLFCSNSRNNSTGNAMVANAKGSFVNVDFDLGSNSFDVTTNPPRVFIPTAGATPTFNNGADGVNILQLQDNGTPKVTFPDGMTTPDQGLQLYSSDNIGSLNWSEPMIDPRKQVIFYDDFMTYFANTKWIETLNGAGADVFPSNTTNHTDDTHAGVILLSTGGDADGRSCIQTEGAALKITNGRVVMEAVIQFSDLAVGGGEDYEARIGLMTQPGLAGRPTNGIFFEYDRSNGGTGTQWKAIIKKGAGVTEFGGGSIVVAADVWYRLRLEYEAGTARLSISVGGGALQQVGSGSSNMPDDVNDRLAIGVMIEKTAGTAARFLLSDQVYFNKTFNGSR
jgi:hypothetical protein